MEPQKANLAERGVAYNNVE